MLGQISAAVDALSTTSTETQTIFIEEGSYDEQVYIPALSGKLIVYGQTEEYVIRCVWKAKDTNEGLAPLPTLATWSTSPMPSRWPMSTMTMRLVSSPDGKRSMISLTIRSNPS